MQRINNSMPLVTTTSSPPDPSQARGKISKRANAYYVKSIEPLELERIIVIFPDYADPNPPITPGVPSWFWPMARLISGRRSSPESSSIDSIGENWIRFAKYLIF